jgi:4-diphosphocytidyl-2-C-methyl-D-erythritol kinase
MICFPNAKINIGLNVLEKREDGYHNLESIFYPVNWCDALEAMQTEGYGSIELQTFGNSIPGSVENNLCAKAYNLLNAKYKLPSVKAWLLKTIPMGAGLGGGSADAAFFLKLLNELFQLNLNTEDLKKIASQIGSDCAFFVDNKPAFVSGKGDVLTPMNIDLNNYYISVVCPQIHVETQKAYSLVTPDKKPISLKQIVIDSPIHSWKELVTNDFEVPIFNSYPQLAEIKNRLYKEGAIYASMTGSGSALYGIFEKKPYLSGKFPNCKIWINPPRKLI